MYGFKDQGRATFDTFSILIAQTNGGNVKDFELLAGSDSPTGPFESIGQLTTQNVRLMESPYQEFKFPPVTTQDVSSRRSRTTAATKATQACTNSNYSVC